MKIHKIWITISMENLLWMAVVKAFPFQLTGKHFYNYFGFFLIQILFLFFGGI